jgi:hypothetical protein
MLLVMSETTRGTPRPLQPSVTQRDIELEVAQCVGGVSSPLLLNIALHGMEQAAGVCYRTLGADGAQTVAGTPALVRYADLCRIRHKSAYAESRIMRPRR